jgi:hypothetical protein
LLGPGLARGRHRRRVRRRRSTAVDRRGAVDGVAAGRLLEQAIERLALLVVEVAEHLVLDGGERELRFGESLRPGRGELDDMSAAILARAPPLDQLVGLELVEQPDEVGAGR